MSTHTDRIRQMAQEAGFERFKDESVDPINFEPSPDGMWVLWDDDALARFAQLVAEDCARVCDDRAVEMAGFTEEEHASQHLAAAIRARYSLKD